METFDLPVNYYFSRLIASRIFIKIKSYSINLEKISIFFLFRILIFFFFLEKIFSLHKRNVNDSGGRKKNPEEMPFSGKPPNSLL